MVSDMKLTNSGLAIYVDQDTCELSRPWVERFENRIGYDEFTEKGMMGVVVRFQSQYLFEVITTHPQAYIRYDDSDAPSASESKEDMDSMLSAYHVRKTIVKSIQEQGGPVQSVRVVHRLQLDQIRRAMDRELSKVPVLPFDAVIVAADMNINRYNTDAGSEAERDPTTAYTQDTHPEFQDMLVRLNVQAAALSGSTLCDRFTWNPQHNTVIPNQPHHRVYQWIDYVLVRALSKRVTTLRNQVMRCQTNDIPFPELGAFWQTQCVRERESASYRLSKPSQQANYEYQERFYRGCQQVRRLLRRFCQQTEAKTTITPFCQKAINSSDEDRKQGIVMWVPAPKHPLYVAWCKWVRSSATELGDQVWKGLDLYGFRATDKNVTESYFDPNGRPLGIGMPHGYRMMSDASDHQAVLGTISLLL